MSSHQRIALALAAVLAGCSTDDSVGPSATEVAPRADGAEPTIIHETVPVSFTIPEGACGLTTTVTGTGELRLVIQFTERPDGTFNPAPINSTAHGTAVGEDGTRYVFSYQNNSIVTDETGGFSLPFTAEAVDKFLLVGGGSAPDVHVFARFTIRINEDGTVTFSDVKARGDPACDAV